MRHSSSYKKVEALDTRFAMKVAAMPRADRSSHTRHYISPGPLIQMDTDNNNVNEETSAKNTRYKHGRLSTIVIYKAK